MFQTKTIASYCALATGDGRHICLFERTIKLTYSTGIISLIVNLPRPAFPSDQYSETNPMLGMIKDKHQCTYLYLFHPIPKAESFKVIILQNIKIMKK
jgi:hypothetical protein